MTAIAKRSVMYLPGVGPKKAELLRKEARIASFEDLLYYFPYKYVDRSRFYTVAEINGEMPYIQIRGKITSFAVAGEGRARRLAAKFADGEGGVIELVWFRGVSYIKDKYRVGTSYIVFGKPSEFGQSFSIVHPEIDPEENASQVASGLTPFYNTTERMKKAYLHSRAIQNLQFVLLNQTGWTPSEVLPPYVIRRTRMIPLSDAVRLIHFPESPERLKAARLRLKFDELFFIQLHILQTAAARKEKTQGLVCPIVGAQFHTFYNQYLPFALTDAQKKVVREIRADLGSGRQMNRLLQGDVGSGKTLVALMAMLIAVDNDYQACLMAPTEILATQHYHTLMNFLGDMNITVELLTGSTSRKERNRMLPAVAKGQVNILVGTHALIEKSVIFASLGLAIIDEQHRFGVEQRSKLHLKNEQPPHILVMTATPIPRTLAMTLYGDLDVSVIDRLPPGRKPVKTIHRYDNRKTEIYSFLRREINLGRQAYIVYPLIEGSETLDYKALEEGYELFGEVFPDLRIAMVHGRMKPAEKDAAMNLFASGEAQILMATTVIEVGVNVPNASVMVIESAERFGLSQLHQLRGRVGRGSEQSYCILLSSCKLSADTRRRLEIMTQTSDGFEIAEADLRMRGHGELEGTRQSGPGFDLRIADLATDGQILAYARNTAAEILDADPTLEAAENAILRERLKDLFAGKIDWGTVS
ncbi:MAG: ATP-dependent DNA helicase RecG [Tannerellaceae bacterium]|jgi:ATP-dependent DNA helicase RecG|nr:ATP-dependent DNA helicase RecG [Tannerellaceae bacterium]